MNSYRSEPAARHGLLSFGGPLDRAIAALDNALGRLVTRRMRDIPTACVLLSPIAVVLGVFGLVPLGYAIYMSMFGGKWGMGGFVGLGNYARALQSGAFWRSFCVTLYYAVGTIPITLLLGFAVANLLFRIGRGKGLFRTLYFLPYVTSAVAAAMIWRTIFNPQFGVANAVLTACGFSAQTWLLEPRSVLSLLTSGVVPAWCGPSLALCCVMMFEVWHSVGFAIIIFLAGLTTIPRELEDAARIDGANWYQITRHISLPLLSPTIFFLTVVSAIRAFQAFDGFYALTGDGRGPLDTTQNMTVYIYAEFYEYHRWGYGAAVATILCVAIVALTLLQWRLVGRRVHNQ